MNKLDTRLGGLALGATAVLGSLLSGCGVAADDHMSSEGEIATVTQPFVESGNHDRPGAAAISRTVNGVDELWVFACSTTNHIIRNTKPDYKNRPENAWSGWKTIASSKTCFSPPTVGKWAGNQPAETILLYWRDGTDNLIEVRFNSDGSSTSTTNLSSTLGVGAIAGRPIIAQTNNATGAIEAVSIAFISKATGELKTADFSSATWHVRPILLANGTTATGSLTGFSSFAAGYSARAGDGIPQGTLSFHINQAINPTDVIFQRKFWTRSFKEVARVTDPTLNHSPTLCGPVTFGGNIFEPSDVCGVTGCAFIRRCDSNGFRATSLANTGELFWKFTDYSSDIPMPGRATGSLYSVNDGSDLSGMGVAIGNGSDSGILGVDAIGGHGAFGISHIKAVSAPILANGAVRQIFFQGGDVFPPHLYYIDFQGFFNFGEVDLGPVQEIPPM